MKILGIGESVIDNTYMVDASQESIPTGLPTQHIGGPVLIAMMLLARLGITCTFMTTLGRDRQAVAIRELLEDESIQLIPQQQERTKINTILVNKHNGSRKKLRGTVLHPYIEGLDRKFLQQFDVIIMDRHEKIAFYEIMLKKKKSTKVIIDPSTEVSNFTMDMIKYADYPILPVEALYKIHSNIETGLQILYKHCKRPFIVTIGEKGSIVFDGKQTDHIPAIAVHAIDVNGAGDIYRGGFAYGIVQGWSRQQSAAFGSLIAGMQCTKVGNAAAVPTRPELEALMKQQYNNVTIL